MPQKGRVGAHGMDEPVNTISKHGCKKSLNLEMILPCKTRIEFEMKKVLYLGKCGCSKRNLTTDHFGTKDKISPLNPFEAFK